MGETWIPSKFTEVYIKGIKYQGISWVDDPDALLQLISDEINKISDLSYLSIAVNTAQVLATAQTPTQYTEMVVFLKNVKYKNLGYLIITDATILRDNLKAALDSIEDLEHSDVEIRTNSLVRKVY